MRELTLVLVIAAAFVATGIVAVVVWFLYNSYLTHKERRLAARKGLFRDLVTGLAARERALLEPILREWRTLHDFDALEAVLEEQARSATDRPTWLLDAYDRLGLIDKYIHKLRHARRWRDRAFAAELLGRVGNARAVPALLETVQATRTEDSDVREIALRALARIADPRAVAPLVDALRHAEVWLAPRLADILARHGDAVVDPMIALLDEPTGHPARAWAVSVLGELRAARAYPSLLRALDDVDAEVRAKAATALGRIGDRRAVPHLLERLLSDRAPFVRTRIARALGGFDDPAVIDRLVRALGDEAWWVRMRSVEALGEIGASAEGPLLLALDDADPEIRVRAAVAIERLGIPARLLAMVAGGEGGPDAQAILVKLAASAAHELLAEGLRYPAPAARRAVAAAIGHAERGDLARELIRAARHDSDPPVRAAAFHALRRLGVEGALSAAFDALADPDDSVRAAAFQLAGELGGPQAVTQLRSRIADPDPTIRAAAARALGLLGAGGTAAELIPLLDDADPEVQISAATALEQLGDADAIPALTERYDAAPAELRAAILGALGTLGAEAGVPLAAAALHDPDDRLRAAAIDTLVQLDAAAYERAIRPLLVTDPSPGVRERAALAVGLFRPAGGEIALAQAFRRWQPARVRAAIALATAAYEETGTVARVLEMAEQEEVRGILHERIGHDQLYRLLGERVRDSERLELRALVAPSHGETETALAEGARSTFNVGERIRLVSGLRTFQGARSWAALLQLMRADPSAEVRNAALVAVASARPERELVDLVMPALADPSPAVRRTAVSLLARAPAREALTALLRGLRRDDDPSVLQAAARRAEAAPGVFAELAQHAELDEHDAAMLIRIARHIEGTDLARPLVRFARARPAARAALAWLWSERPELADDTALNALSADPLAEVRRQAARAAAARRRYDLLTALADDPDPAVRTAALAVRDETTR